jgi:hypothetical protein
MSRTTFSGPVRSLNGFEGDMLSGTISSGSANITNLTVTSLTIGSTKLTNGSVSGVVGGSQLGRIPVLIGSTTRYIALYDSLTP